MDFRPDVVFLIILFIWSGILTAFFIRFFLSYSRLFQHAQKGNVVKLLDDLVASNEIYKKEITQLKKHCDLLDRQGQLHIQKIGLLRFNPFKDTGGDQSFILALVDAHGTGVVISGLHTRSGTRWYAKKVVNAKGVEYELSEDEHKALKEARNGVE